MREILFRGKRKCNGDWLFGGFHSRFDRAFIIGCSKSFRIDGMELFPDTVGQFTGFYDKNGKKIFEGDIVIASLNSGNYRGFSWGAQKVVFSQGAFCLEDRMDRKTPLGSFAPTVEFEVIGNIHDNPELLEG